MAPHLSLPAAASGLVASPCHVLLAGVVRVQLDAHAVVDHPGIIGILEEGWSSHIPLSALTNKACQAALFVDYSGSGSLTRRPQLASDSAAEPSMSLGDWVESWPRLCAYIARHLASPDRLAISEAFRAHFV